LIEKEIKRRLNSDNAWLPFSPEHLSSRVVCKNVKVKIYRNIILSVALYGCETWSLILREKNRLRVFEIRVLRRILGQKSDEVTGGWRKLHTGVLHKLQSLADIIRMIKSRRMRWQGI
jgi:hypothetical protein